jgi:hypothetical protein
MKLVFLSMASFNSHQVESIRLRRMRKRFVGIDFMGDTKRKRERENH